MKLSILFAGMLAAMAIAALVAGGVQKGEP
jgi:hypothetical protein